MADEHTNHAEGYEKRDVSVSKTLVVAFLVILVIVSFLIVLNEYFLSVTEEIKYDQVLSRQPIDLRELRAHETELLNSYQVIDSAAGRYRIPIDRAMQLEADEAFQEQVK